MSKTMTTPHRSSCLGTMLLLALAPVASASGPFSITAWTVDGGGGRSSGGVFALEGTIGQHDATLISCVSDPGDPEFELDGGFWFALSGAGPSTPRCLGDLTLDGVVDGADLAFVLAGWGGASGDLNGDGITDGADLALVLAAWGACADG